jgi:hypothetical protein
MGDAGFKIERLLRSAAQATPEDSSFAPFGFETRVVALWRAGAANGNGNGVAGLIRRVAIMAVAVIVVSTAATIREFKQTQENIGEPLANEFAIADSAIQNEFLQ